MSSNLFFLGGGRDNAHMNMVTTLHVIGSIIVNGLDYAGYYHGSLPPQKHAAK